MFFLSKLSTNFLKYTDLNYTLPVEICYLFKLMKNLLSKIPIPTYSILFFRLLMDSEKDSKSIIRNFLWQNIRKNTFLKSISFSYSNSPIKKPKNLIGAKIIGTNIKIRGVLFFYETRRLTSENICVFCNECGSSFVYIIEPQTICLSFLCVNRNCQSKKFRFFIGKEKKMLFNKSYVFKKQYYKDIPYEPFEVVFSFFFQIPTYFCSEVEINGKVKIARNRNNLLSVTSRENFYLSYIFCGNSNSFKIKRQEKDRRGNFLNIREYTNLSTFFISFSPLRNIINYGSKYSFGNYGILCTLILFSTNQQKAYLDKSLERQIRLEIIGKNLTYDYYIFLKFFCFSLNYTNFSTNEIDSANIQNINFQNNSLKTVSLFKSQKLKRSKILKKKKTLAYSRTLNCKKVLINMRARNFAPIRPLEFFQSLNDCKGLKDILELKVKFRNNYSKVKNKKIMRKRILLNSSRYIIRRFDGNKKNLIPLKKLKDNKKKSAKYRISSFGYKMCLLFVRKLFLPIIPSKIKVYLIQLYRKLSRIDLKLIQCNKSYLIDFLSLLCKARAKLDIRKYVKKSDLMDSLEILIDILDISNRDFFVYFNRMINFNRTGQIKDFSK